MKAATVVISYDETGGKSFRLQHGKHSPKAIRTKLKAVENDSATNEAIALSTLVSPNS